MHTTSDLHVRDAVTCRKCGLRYTVEVWPAICYCGMRYERRGDNGVDTTRKGLGDAAAWVLSLFGVAKCGPCDRRRLWLNRIWFRLVDAIR